jgi:hypothetical protein
MLTPEEAVGEGPHIYIALPEDYFEHVPVNATRLLWEWEAQLDPVAVLTEAARRRLPRELGWGWGRWFVEPTIGALALARRAAEDEELRQLLEEVAGTWVIDESARSDVGNPVRDSLTMPTGEARELNGLEISFLLGMGVIAAIDLPIGYHGPRIANGIWRGKAEGGGGAEPS